MALFDTIRGKWKLDDLLIDDGGRVPDLTNVNGVTLGTGHDGTPNTARVFNGTNQAITAAPSEWVNSIGGSMSISVWIYPTGAAVATSEVIVEAIDQSGTDAAFSLAINPADEIQFVLYRPGRIPFGIPTGVTVAFNQWVHVVAIWDQENHRFYLYLDGVLANSQLQPSNYELQTAPDAPLVIGNVSTLAAPFSGTIDDLVIYGRAITTTEKDELYALGDNFDQISGPIVDVPPGDISDVSTVLQTDGDVLLYQTADGGEINVTNGVVQMSGGLETAVYLSLFGGNEDDSGQQNDPYSWWGNADEPDPVRHYRSETQYLLKALPLVSSNLRRVEDAVKKDLAWMITEKAASSVTVSATIPGLNKIQISVNVVAEGVETDFIFIENWKIEI